MRDAMEELAELEKREKEELEQKLAEIEKKFAETSPEEMVRKGMRDVLKALQEKPLDPGWQWFCNTCKKDVSGNYCSACGEKRHPFLKLKCGGCGQTFELEEGLAPKFCTNCGQAIDGDDLVFDFDNKPEA